VLTSTEVKSILIKLFLKVYWNDNLKLKMSVYNILEKASFTTTGVVNQLPAGVILEYERVDRHVTVTFRKNNDTQITTVDNTAVAYASIGLVGTYLQRDRDAIGQPLLLPIVIGIAGAVNNKVLGFAELEGLNLSFTHVTVGATPGRTTGDVISNGSFSYVLPLGTTF
jgi:hypothetical protein